MMLAKSILCGALALLAAQPALADKAVREDIPCGDGKIVVWTEQDYEEEHVIVWFRDGAGKELRPNVIAPGRVVPMCSRGVFLLFDDTGSHMIAGLSWLMSARGDVLGGYDLGQFTVKHAVTSDEALFWVQSFEWDGKAPRTRLVAIAADGAVVHDRQYDAASRITVTHAGKEYPVDVMKPDLPG